VDYLKVTFWLSLRPGCSNRDLNLVTPSGNLIIGNSLFVYYSIGNYISQALSHIHAENCECVYLPCNYSKFSSICVRSVVCSESLRRKNMLFLQTVYWKGTRKSHHIGKQVFHITLHKRVSFVIWISKSFMFNFKLVFFLTLLRTCIHFLLSFTPKRLSVLWSQSNIEKYLCL
jgi:hypothetical protein